MLVPVGKGEMDYLSNIDLNDEAMPAESGNGLTEKANFPGRFSPGDQVMNCAMWLLNTALQKTFQKEICLVKRLVFSLSPDIRYYPDYPRDEVIDEQVR
ncbi:hypothetical protein Clacol_005976 [Clathrus columnatus]|uniref:Uncharacterized protein n=1 Tax=Clathrus columnatus TaxID=1419009 RepID=A0AAV5AF27_9AGAM|nr:hypothetical protein Clacol_005976 [Clathrus columnatus]